MPAADRLNDNPLILCEAYRGTHGGLTQAFYSDVCRVWYYGTIPAGGSITATIPVKIVGGVGDFTTWGGAEIYPTDAWGAGPLVPLNNNQWLPLTVHSVAPPPKVATGGSGLPDLQATAKASTGSPAVGSWFYLLFTVRNSGKVDATDTQFTATLPAGLVPASAYFEFGDCTVTGQTVSCVSSRPVSSSLAQSVQIDLVAPATLGTYSATGTFANSNGDSNPGNNSATVAISIK